MLQRISSWRSKPLMWTLGVYLMACLIIMLPMLLPGYILALDMVFTPKLALPTDVSSSYLLDAFLFVLNTVLPSQIIQKILLFLVLFLSGLATHRLVQRLDNSKQQIESRWRTTNDTRPTNYPAYAAGLLYMANPFTYSRFMSGQYQVLLGYALLPFFVVVLLKFIAAPKLGSSLKLAALAVGISIVSIHTAGMALLLALVGGILTLARFRKDRQRLGSFIKYSAISILAVLVASSYWLIPLFTGSNQQAQAILSFDNIHQQAFATQGSGAFGPLLSVLRLQGFWADAQGLYRLPQTLPVLPYLALAIMLSLVAYGIYRGFKKYRFVTVFFVVTGILAVIFATGTSGLFAPVNRAVQNVIPYFSGYREPQKFVALLALCYAVFLYIGLERLLEHLKPVGRSAAAAVALSLPVLLVPAMVWGFNGQLKPRQYPSDWQALNQYMNRTIPGETVLFLPWHQYMSFNFSHRIIANPADRFFDTKIIISNNPEFSNLPNPNKTSLAGKIDSQVLPQAPTRTDLAAKLKPMGIKYIILAKELDYRKYGYLERQDNLQLVFRADSIELYRLGNVK